MLRLLLAVGAVTGIVRLLFRRRTHLAGVDAVDLEAGFELSDMSARAVATLGVGLMATLAVIVLAASWIQLGLAGAPAQVGAIVSEAAAPTDVSPGEPRLEAVSGETLARVRASERERLNTYAWISRKDGIARVPIDVAMDLIVQRGLPTDPTGAGYSEETRPSDSSSGRVEQRLRP
jgi:hypothetical protein